MRIITILAPLILFVIGGILGVFSRPFIQIGQPFFYWLLIPSLVLGVYYTFRVTAMYDKHRGGVIALGRILLTMLITIVSFRAIQGYVILLNCNFGKQTERELVGTVSFVDFPKPKKFFDKNKITVLEIGSNSKIILEVPFDSYLVGQLFQKKMTIGMNPLEFNCGYAFQLCC
jgi:hypothetical protein